MTVPRHPKIYHIVHVDRLASIVADGFLWSDAKVLQRASNGTTIGMSSIKRRRLEELTLTSRPGLRVGQCVPFYFCPRSVMLYLLYMGNHPELEYRSGQGPIVHLEADLHRAVAWPDQNDRRWAFSLSNAGSYYFEDPADLAELGEIDWDAVQARDWKSCKDGKQAEFFVEHRFPWELVERVGVRSATTYLQVLAALPAAGNRLRVEVLNDWYY